MKLNMGDRYKIKSAEDKNKQLKTQITAISTSELPTEIARLYKLIENLNEQMAIIINMVYKSSEEQIVNMPLD